jgi:hypothetical protein
LPPAVFMGNTPPMLRDFDDDTVSISGSEPVQKKLLSIHVGEAALPIFADAVTLGQSGEQELAG